MIEKDPLEDSDEEMHKKGKNELGPFKKSPGGESSSEEDSSSEEESDFENSTDYKDKPPYYLKKVVP